MKKIKVKTERAFVKKFDDMCTLTCYIFSDEVIAVHTFPGVFKVGLQILVPKLKGKLLIFVANVMLNRKINTLWKAQL